MKKLIFVTCLAVLLSGCSVFKASKQPGKKNIELFQEGTPRLHLIAEFGQPVASETDSKGRTCELFSFVQGYDRSTKIGRAILHGVADVYTLGLWEIVGTPTENAFNGNQMAYQVCYDKDNKVNEVVALSQKDEK